MVTGTRRQTYGGRCIEKIYMVTGIRDKYKVTGISLQVYGII